LVVKCLRHNAVKNILSVLGFAETEVEVLRRLPGWKDCYETPEVGGLFWQSLDQGGGPGADHPLRRMLALSLRRQGEHKPNS
jgi:hypothetical protein